MADNRMAIVCKICRLGIAIAKRYHGQSWGQYPLNEGRVDKFFLKHADCGFSERHYYLGYEDEDDWEYDMVVVDKHKG